MGLEEARTAMESGLSENTQQPAESAEPSSQNVSDPSAANTPSSLTDIAKLQKFMFEGKEWTVDELKKSILRQSDYTKKTQALAEERNKWGQFRDNYDADLQKVIDDPTTWREIFLKTYPKEFHSRLERDIERLGNVSVQEETQEQPQGDPKLTALERKLEMLEQKEYQREREQAEKYIDSSIEKFSKKYELADQDLVLARAEVLISSNAKLDDAAFEKIFKESHERNLERAKAHGEKMFKGQSQANSQAKDTSIGGGTPGQAPIVPKTIKDATRQIMADIEAGKRI